LPECRTVPDEATYQRVLAIAEDNCPEVAQTIKADRRMAKP